MQILINILQVIFPPSNLEKKTQIWFGIDCLLFEMLNVFVRVTYADLIHEWIDFLTCKSKKKNQQRILLEKKICGLEHWQDFNISLF